MVANAGMTKHQPALQFTREGIEKLFNLNVFGAFSCAQIAARKFIALGIKGFIVFAASMTSYRPNRAALSAPYGGTKAAMCNMTHTRHGVGQARYPRQLHLSGLREDRYDLLRREGARLGPQDELLWRYTPARNAAGTRGGVCVFVERYC